jgi:MerR family transcriptional regulator, light-induced transcriptional regulator
MVKPIDLLIKIPYVEAAMRNIHSKGLKAEDDCLDSETSKVVSKEPVDILIQMLDQEIIPRLLVSHHANSPLEELASTGLRPIHPAEIDLLCGLSINSSQESCTEFVKKLLAKKVSIDSIYLELIPQVARKLGVLWEQDICTFSEVTIGLWRLQHILYGLSREFQVKNNSPIENLNALLIPAPRSQHTIGLFIVSEFFRRAGWRVWGEPNLLPEDVNNLIFSQWFDVIGISVGFEEQLPDVNQMILSLRARSMNPNVAFMVGGPLYNSHPELFDDIAADIKSSDANDAIRQAEIFVAKKKTQRMN